MGGEFSMHCRSTKLIQNFIRRSERRSLCTSINRRQDNIKMHLKEAERQEVDRIHLVQDIGP
jgi:hypothetical protein